MSDKTTAETKKGSQTVIPSHSLIPEHHLDLPRRADEAPASSDHALQDTVAESSRGHDFGRVRVYSDAKAESCPPKLTTPTLCPFGGTCHTCPPRIQTKLTVGHSDDSLEKQADEVAKSVVNMKEPLVRRQTGPEAIGRDTHQAKPPSESVAPALEAQINALRGGGQPLDPAPRAFMEPRFGRNFSQVRVHTDNQAVKAAQAVNARAFTMGSDIVFGNRQYEPKTREGKRLLAHELTHVMQQNHRALSSYIQTQPARKLSAVRIYKVCSKDRELEEFIQANQYVTRNDHGGESLRIFTLDTGFSNASGHAEMAGQFGMGPRVNIYTKKLPQVKFEVQHGDCFITEWNADGFQDGEFRYKKSSFYAQIKVK
jgi:hypothetical protein